VSIYLGEKVVSEKEYLSAMADVQSGKRTGKMSVYDQRP
jgi:hypothetical protein